MVLCWELKNKGDKKGYLFIIYLFIYLANFCSQVGSSAGNSFSIVSFVAFIRLLEDKKMKMKKSEDFEMFTYGWNLQVELKITDYAYS